MEIDQKKTNVYLNSLLKASKAPTINKKLQYLSEGLQNLGWEKIGIFTYTDDLKISDSFLVGLNQKVLIQLNPFRTNPEGRKSLVDITVERKSFFITWDEGLKLRGLADKALKKMYSALGYNEGDNPIGLMIPLRSDTKIVGSMHIVKGNRKGWDKDLGITELYANYTSHILEEYRLMESLKKSHSRYQMVFENSHDPIVLINKDGLIKLCNNRFCGLIDKNNKTLKNKPFIRFLSRNTKKFDELLDKTLERITGELETEIIKDNKEKIPVKISFHPHIYADLEPHIELVIYDLSKNVELQKRAENIESKYKSIFDNATDGIALLNEKGEFISINPAGLKQIGYSEQEIQGRNYEILIENKFKGIVNKMIRGTALGESFDDKTVDIIRKDGTKSKLSISSSKLYSENDEPTIMLIARDVTAQIEAFEAKEKSESEYRRILENLPDIYYRCNKDDIIEYINPASAKILGYTSHNKLIGKSLIKTLCANKNEAEEVLNRLRAKGSITNSPILIKRKDGTSVYCEENAQLIKDKNNNIIGREGIIRDESRRKSAEKAYAESERQYIELTENLPIGIYRTTPDLEGKLIYYNKALIKMFGYDTGEEMQKVSVKNYYQNPEQRRNFIDEIDQKGFLKVESPMVTKDGKTIWISDSCHAVRDKNGKMIYIDGTIEDITARKKLEHKLKESEKRYRLIAENVTDVIWTIGPDLKYTYISPSIKTLRGFDPKELIGKHISTILTPDSYKIVEKELAKRIKEVKKKKIKNRIVNTTMELELARKDGTTTWVEINSVLFLDEKGNPEGMQGVTRDISKRKEAEEALAEQVKLLDEKVRERTRELAKTNEELVRADKVRSEFLANISHELRSPLTSILGYTEIMQSYDLDKDETINYLEIITSQANQLLKLVNSLLDIAKLESAALNLVLTPTDINKIIHTVENHLRLKLKRAKLKLIMNLSSEINKANLDSHKIYQIIHNLVDNAIKFTPENMTIQIESRQTENEIQIRVIDEGIGIEQKHIKSIFDPFFQVDSSSTRSYEGAGLGLHLVKNLVELHHGRIWVESELNKGTTFTVCFPANLKQTGKVPKKITGPIKISRDQFKKYRILVIDDDVEISNLLKISLKNDFDILSAENGKVGVEKAIEEQPDLIFMDLSMPVLSGYEATRILKEREETKNIPIVALSARAMKSEVDKAMQVGCDDHLPKPFRLKELKNVIEKNIVS